MANIPGTNIPTSAIAGNIKGDAAYWADRLRGAENPNDVLFEMAYSTPFAGQTLLPGQDVWQGQGQGNPNVGALQSNIWSLTGDQPSWAEQAVQNPGGQSDIYQDRSDPDNVTAVAGVDYGQAASADDMARAGTNLAGQSHFFTGTNIPTTGFTASQINEYNRALSTEINAKNWKGANDVMFNIAWDMGKNFYGSPTDDQGGYGQGNKFVGMLQSDMFSLTDPDASMWAEEYINSENDEYVLRDVTGAPRGGTVKLGDAGSYIDMSGAGANTIAAQDWTRFGTNPAAPPPLQQGGLINYQLYAGAPTGTGVNLIGGGGSNNIWDNTLGTDSIVNTATDGANSSTSSTMTDAQGKTWIMSNGQWYPSGSDYAKALSGIGTLYPFGHYDSGGMYMGSEGGGKEEAGLSRDVNRGGDADTGHRDSEVDIAQGVI